jgi:hypothetical protein
MVRSKPRITEFTARPPRRSTLASLDVAIESFHLGVLKESVSYLHHSIRRLIRYLYTPLRGVKQNSEVIEDVKSVKSLRCCFKSF